MTNPNTFRTKDELLADLDTAKASYDSAEIGKLEAQIKELEAKGQEHQEEMKGATQEANEEKTMKMEELTNLLKGKPGNAEKNTETIIEQAKTRLQATIDRYISKIKELKNTNTEEVTKLKEEVKKEKDTYEKVKKSFFAPSTYNFEKFTKEDLKKIPTRAIRYATREGKLFNAPKLTKMATVRRNITIKTLIKKFSKMGDKPKDGVRFVMGFEKARFLRYAGIKVSSAIDKTGSAIGLQMNPQDFHAKFNAGRNAIFALLDADTGDTKTEGEKSVIQAIKNRINYYGTTYARERANAWVAPFVDAEKNAPKEAKIIQMNIPGNEQKLKAA